MPEEKLRTMTYYTRDQVPVCPVFTHAKIKSRFGIKVNFSRHTWKKMPQKRMECVRLLFDHLA